MKAINFGEKINTICGKFFFGQIVFMKITGGIVNIFADGKWNWGQIKRAFQLRMKLDFPWLNWTSSFTNIQPLCGGRGGFWKRRAISPWIIEAILQQTSFWETFSYTICGRQRRYNVTAKLVLLCPYENCSQLFL